MSKYTLSSLDTYDASNVSYRHCDETMPQTRLGYNQKLNDFRNQIDLVTSESWKKVRWYINEYDFQVKDPIINRAFYKYWEIINEFDLFESYNVDTDLVLHLAEAPGGFIQGTNIYLQMGSRVKKVPQMDTDGFVTVKRRARNNYLIYSMSLNKDLPQYKIYNLPTYNRGVINKQVCISYGKDHTGDINNFENVRYLKGLSKKNFYLVTADGGFDEGIDFNNKEQLHYTLILSEIKSAIFLQQQHGHFLLKVFDIFTETSLHLLYALSLAYTSVCVYKPRTSRPTNSEKYIVCRGFRLSESDRIHFVNAIDNSHKSFLIFKTVPESFVDQVRKVNDEMVEKQCVYLESAIQLCNDNGFLLNYEHNVSRLIDARRATFNSWETFYNLNSFV